MTQVASPITSERDLLDQVLELSALLGWEAAHFRPALTNRGWRTPVQGSLGKGFPDLVLVRERDRRLIFAELKSDVGRLAPEQERVLELLRSIPGATVAIWRPRDWDTIVEVLR